MQLIKVPVFTARPIHSAKVFQRSGSLIIFVIVDEIKCMKMWITVPVEYRGREVESLMGWSKVCDKCT